MKELLSGKGWIAIKGVVQSGQETIENGEKTLKEGGRSRVHLE